MQTQVKNQTLDRRGHRLCAGWPSAVRGLKSRSSPPRRRAGHPFWAPPPSRSTAARSPMGWTRAPARGPTAAPLSSTEPPWVASSLLLAVLRHFGGGIGEGATKVGADCGLGPGRRRSPPPARLPAAGQKKAAAAGAVLRSSGEGRNWMV
jgi:hypothetical protein